MVHHLVEAGDEARLLEADGAWVEDGDDDKIEVVLCVRYDESR